MRNIRIRPRRTEMMRRNQLPTPSPTPSAVPRGTLCRQGPRPLALHLMTAGTVWGSSRLALPLLKSGSLSWNPALDASVQELLRALDGVAPADLSSAVDAELCRRSERFISGVEQYRNHPHCRSLTDPPVVWQEGSTRLLDYGPSHGAPVLVIPSLINRPYILDLEPDRSFLRYLSTAGLRCLLVDWGRPGDLERGFGLTDYIAGRLDQAFEAAIELCGGPLGVIGYCMGGLFAVALASRHQRDLAGLVLLATPWDFHARPSAPPALVAALAPLIDASFAPLGEIPTDILQCLFVMTDPQLAIRKFTRFADVDPDSENARFFVATEDWANDGVPLALPVARECLMGWYGENRPAAGSWRVAGRLVDPATIKTPALVLIPTRDKIVPAPAARALAVALPRATAIELPTGHIGLVAGVEARERVWMPVRDQLLVWLQG